MNGLPKDENVFRKWLRQECERLRIRNEQARFDPSECGTLVDAPSDAPATRAELDESDFEDAAATVREAGEIALRLHLPDAYNVVSNVRHGPLAIDLARLILSEVLRSIPETELPPAEKAEYDIGPNEGPLTVAQVANRLGISKGKVYGLCRNRVMPHDRFGKRIVITLEQLATFQETSQNPAVKTSGFRNL